MTQSVRMNCRLSLQAMFEVFQRPYSSLTRPFSVGKNTAEKHGGRGWTVRWNICRYKWESMGPDVTGSMEMH